MKKTILYTSLSVSLLLASASCNNSSKGGNAADYENKSAEAASHVIEYTNLLIDISNKQNDYIDRVLENLDKIEKGLHKPDDHFAFIGIISPSYHGPLRYSKVKAEEPVDELSSEDKKFFKEKVGVYNTAFKKIQDQYGQLSDYLKAQDYKDDKSVKGLALVDSVRLSTQQLLTIKAELIGKVNKIADASEAIVLKDSPLKDYILAMKADLQAVRSFIDIVESDSSFTKVKDKAQTAYNALEKAQSEHSQIKIDNAKEAHKDNAYKLFYDRMHDFLLESRKILRDAGDAGSLTQYQLDNLNRNYDYLIERYNSFNS
ncbi:YiiG family protein [Chitinophaga solisilvae]|uniref:YiiG family protein n=1 Tax=Chitinophaga solisilvae TaxID=1233460 RepID=UPI00136AAC00|nr:YiiG family protein [Chitinophaga solisilvae]